MPCYRVLPCRAVTSGLFTVLAVLPSLSAGEKEDARRNAWHAAIDKIKPAVVVVRGTASNADKRAPKPGYGVIVDSTGIVVTPRSHITGASKIEVTLADGRRRLAKVVLSDPQTEVAILKMDSGKPLPFAQFGDSDRLQVADSVLSLHSTGGVDLSLSFERGIISGRRRVSPGNLELLFVNSAVSYALDRDLLINREGKLIGVWNKPGVVPSNRLNELIRPLLKRK